MSSWVPRYSAPSVGDPYYTSTQPLNPQPGAQNPYPVMSAGDFVLPNCTGLACGRQIEQGYGAEIRPSNAFGDAATWWEAAANFYERGQDPRIGAVAVWGGGVPPYQNAGHVGTVEDYDPDTGIISISNSAAGGFIFYMTYPSDSDPNVGMNANYFFKGYFYPAGQPKPSWFYPLISKKRRNKLYARRKHSL